jgi:uncharacterized protein (DUF305 family)
MDHASRTPAPRRRTILAGAAAVLYASVLAGCTSGGSPQPVPSVPDFAPSQQVTPMSSQQAEATTNHYTAGAVRELAARIAVADLAVRSSTTSGRVRKFATDVKKRNTAELKALRDWVATHDKDAVGVLDSAQKTAVKNIAGSPLAKLKGAAFDRAWLAEVLNRHNAYSTQIEGARRATTDAGLRKKLDQMSKDAKADFDRLRNLLK